MRHCCLHVSFNVNPLQVCALLMWQKKKSIKGQIGEVSGFWLCFAVDRWSSQVISSHLLPWVQDFRILWHFEHLWFSPRFSFFFFNTIGGGEVGLRHRQWNLQILWALSLMLRSFVLLCKLNESDNLWFNLKGGCNWIDSEMCPICIHKEWVFLLFGILIELKGRVLPRLEMQNL